MTHNEKRLFESRQYWDNQAATFDNEPDHGLHDASVREAWANLFVRLLPSSRSAILDVGCGTGSLSVLLASLGHSVTGIDLSPAMIAQAEAKAKTLGQRITFKVMDASNPDLSPQQFDVIVCRHLLWALPELAQILKRWADMLLLGGHFLLIEGLWWTGGGLHAEEIVSTLPPSLVNTTVQNLSDQPNLWGGEVADERYVVIAEFCG